MYRYMNRAAFGSAALQSDLHYLTLFSVFKCLSEPDEARHVCVFRYLLVPMFRCLQGTEAVGEKGWGVRVERWTGYSGMQRRTMFSDQYVGVDETE